MHSEAELVAEYLQELPRDCREGIKTVRAVILENLPDGYVEVMNWGMITYEVPLKVYPYTYNKKPLMYAALASQKNHMAVYMCGLYCHEAIHAKFVKDWKASGKKLDMGKSCVRFKTLEDLNLDLIAEVVASTPMDKFVDDFKNITAARKNK